MKINMKKVLAFTLAEALISVGLIGVLVKFSLSAIKRGNSGVTNKVAVAKIDSTITTVINFMLTESGEYSTQKGLESTQTSKFRRVFYDSLVQAERRISDAQDKRGIVAVGTTTTRIECLQTVDGITWCIPMTDFDKENTVFVGTNKYVPITVYPKLLPLDKVKNDLDYFSNNAIVYGIRKDGRIIFLDNLIDPQKYPHAMHYKAQRLLRNEK